MAEQSAGPSSLFCLLHHDMPSEVRDSAKAMNWEWYREIPTDQLANVADPELRDALAQQHADLREGNTVVTVPTADKDGRLVLHKDEKIRTLSVENFRTLFRLHLAEVACDDPVPAVPDSHIVPRWFRRRRNPDTE